MKNPASLPEPPYYAVIFTTRRTKGDDGYGEMAAIMETLAARQPGFLGVESVREPDAIGITVSYWKDEESILAWKRDAEHSFARQQGRERWYEAYEVRVARVERAYGFRKDGN